MIVLIANYIIGNYGESSAQGLQVEIKKLNVNGKHILVVGSESPWVEAILITEGNTIRLFKLFIYLFIDLTLA